MIAQGCISLRNTELFTSQLRDLFNAGSVGASGGERGHKYIIQATREIEEEMTTAAYEMDDRLFEAYWGHSCLPGNRIDEWIRLADRNATDWRALEELFKNRTLG